MTGIVSGSDIGAPSTHNSAAYQAHDDSATLLLAPEPSATFRHSGAARRAEPGIHGAPKTTPLILGCLRGLGYSAGPEANSFRSATRPSSRSMPQSCRPLRFFSL